MKQRTKLGYTIRTCLFLAIGVVLLTGLTALLQKHKGNEWAVQTGMDLVHKNRNHYDVLFLGTSTVIANISNQELYEKYGIAGVSIGEPEQPVYLSKYTLEDAFRVQSPEIVFLDSKAFFYTKDRDVHKAVEQSDYILHNSIDPIKELSVKSKAVHAAQEYDPNLDEWEYYVPLYYTHTAWKSISESRWRSYDDYDYMNGNVALFSMTNRVEISNGNNRAAEDGLIEQSVVSEIEAISELCKQNEATLILISGYVTLTEAEHMAVQQVADQLDIEYIDINEVRDNISLDLDTDIAEGGDYAHLNINGAVKWSDYLGKYLSTNFEFTDKRKSNAYREYEKQQIVFESQRQTFLEELKLKQALDFYSYIKTLKTLDLKNNAIFVSVFDEGTMGLSENGLKLLKELGLSQYKDIEPWENYVAVIADEGIAEVHDAEAPASIDGYVDLNDYHISSGGFSFAGYASIKISDIEYMQFGRGINIVVYDRLQEKVIDSVFFDTMEQENPLKQRFATITNSSSMRIKQIASGVNKWVDDLG